MGELLFTVDANNIMMVSSAFAMVCFIKSFKDARRAREAVTD